MTWKTAAGLADRLRLRGLALVPPISGIWMDVHGYPLPGKFDSPTEALALQMTVAHIFSVGDQSAD
jgi:hypothetical protein